MACRGHDPHQGSYVIHLRRITATIIIAITLVGCGTPAAAQTPPAPAPVVSHVDRVCSPIAFPYRPADVQRWWNCHRDPNIDRADAGRLAYWLNAVVLNRIAAYLAAVDAARSTSCSGPGDCPALIRRVFTERGLGYQAEAAVRVASCESGFNPRAYNPSSGASGLFQHLSSLFPARAAGAGAPGASPFDPYVNTVAAANMVAASGWSAWVCRP